MTGCVSRSSKMLRLADKGVPGRCSSDPSYRRRPSRVDWFESFPQQHGARCQPPEVVAEEGVRARPDQESVIEAGTLPTQRRQGRNPDRIFKGERGQRIRAATAFAVATAGFDGGEEAARRLAAAGHGGAVEQCADRAPEVD